MTSRLHIDIETRSRVDLKKTGVHRYVRCPDFKILMASWSLDGSPIRTALSDEAIEAIPGLWEPDVVKVAHNAAFERVCFSEFSYRTGAPLGPCACAAESVPEMANGRHEEGCPAEGNRWREYIDPRAYHDTQAVAGELGYPQKLENLARSLGATPKDSAGTRLINLFCKPNRAGGWNDHTTHPMEWLDFIAYCEQDVGTLAEVDELLGDFPTEHERQVYLADQRINDRGIRIDLDLARAAVVVGATNTEQQKARVTEISGGVIENAKSVQQVHAWLAERGSDLPDLRAGTVETALWGPLQDDVHEVLELRQELALAAPAKFASALECHVDGRLHGSFHFFGAHTGRWAGRRTQPHNLPRLAFTIKDPETGKEYHDPVAEGAAILDTILGLGVSAEALKKLVRPLFVGPFTVVDYASIEARVIAWLAGEEWVLQAARDGRDLYVETAERMGGLTRAQGKIAVLALGYNGGPGALRRMAGEGFYIDGNGNPLMGGALGAALQDKDNEAAGNIREMTDDDLYEHYVYPWRDANHKTVLLWRHLERAFRSGGAVGEHLRVEKDGNDRLLRLPSGRAICYRKCGVRTKKRLDKWAGELVDREEVTFWSPQGRRVGTYGGKLAENATQAVARDLLAAALVRLEARGYPVAAHIHDEVLVEGEHDVDTLSKIICELPDWAAGLPVSGEGFVCTRYRKG